MSDFFCGQCGKTFYQKSHADAHRKRKTPCEPPADKPVQHSAHHYTAALPEPDLKGRLNSPMGE